VQAHQRTISSLKYNGKGLFDYANLLKHERPWVGMLSVSMSAGVLDVYDSCDVGYLYGVLIPLYKTMKTMVLRLFKQCDGRLMSNFPDMRVYCIDLLLTC
jgi:hypothetical protein